VRAWLKSALTVALTYATLWAVSIVAGDEFTLGLAFGVLITAVYSLWADGKSAPPEAA